MYTHIINYREAAKGSSTISQAIKRAISGHQRRNFFCGLPDLIVRIVDQTNCVRIRVTGRTLTLEIDYCRLRLRLHYRGRGQKDRGAIQYTQKTLQEEDYQDSIIFGITLLILQYLNSATSQQFCISILLSHQTFILSKIVSV